MVGSKGFCGKHEKTCAYCERTLSPSSVQPYCGSLKCKMRWHKQKQDQTAAYWRNRELELDKQKLSILNRIYGNSEVQKELIDVLQIPHYKLKNEVVETSRVAEFERYLTSLLSTLDNDLTEEHTFQSPQQTQMTVSNSDNIATICAMCRGRCCKKGGDYHAFIQHSTFVRVLENCDISKDEIVSIYLSYVPESATIGSCIYHGSFGCALPEHLRANVCSEFFCRSLSDHLNKYAYQKPINATLVFAVDECDIYEAALVSNDGSKESIS